MYENFQSFTFEIEPEAKFQKFKVKTLKLSMRKSVAFKIVKCFFTSLRRKKENFNEIIIETSNLEGKENRNLEVIMR